MPLGQDEEEFGALNERPLPTKDHLDRRTLAPTSKGLKDPKDAEFGGTVSVR